MATEIERGSDGRATLLRAGLAVIAEAHRPGCQVNEAFGSGAPGEGHYRITHPDSPWWIAVLLRPDDPREIESALDAGASAILCIQSAVMELPWALAAAEGGLPTYLSPAVTRWITRKDLGRPAAQQASDRAPELPRLTRRESEVLELLAKGYTNREIADALVVSVNTVRTHVQALGTKLSGTNRSRIVANALARGWVGTKVIAPDHPIDLRPGQRGGEDEDSAATA